MKSKELHNKARAVRRRENASALALDCEFVQTTNGNLLAQCTVVNLKNEVVFNSFVNPKHKIIRRSLTHERRVTNFSLRDLQHGMPEDDACSEIQRIVKGHILVLQSPLGDFEVLHLFNHPAKKR